MKAADDDAIAVGMGAKHGVRIRVLAVAEAVSRVLRGLERSSAHVPTSSIP
jgi:hypothetical protein